MQKENCQQWADRNIERIGKSMKKKFRLAWCLSLMIFTAKAQHKNVEIGALSDSGKRSIPSVAVSRKDAKFLAVKGAGSTFYLSSDGGLTWQTSTSAGMDQAEWLTMHSDSKGNLFAVYAMP